MKKTIALLLVLIMCAGVAACGSGNDTLSTNAIGANNTNQYELAEITRENWQDYFEIREYHKFEENDFGEFEKVTTYYSLVSKDGIIFDESKSEVTFEFTCSIETKPYIVDFENKTVTYGETTKTRTSEPTVETMNGVGQYIGKTQMIDMVNT